MRYSPDIKNQVRRAYLLKSPCQPHSHKFLQRIDKNRNRRFIFDEFGSLLEYSIAKDAAYCLYCYLFYLGVSKIEYRYILNASIVCLCYLLMQGLAFRGNDESEESLNQGNFIQLLKVLASCNEEINNVVLKNALENLKLIAPSIQKDIINACAVEITNAIIRDLGDDLFSILVDECQDISVKAQMGVVIRYINKFGCVVKRFLGIVHVNDTSASSLKKAIESLFSTHGLSVSSLRGQGYDGASDMKGNLIGLKSLILRENSSAYYVHCFAHQLQLTLVAIAKKHSSISIFLKTVAHLCNIVGGSCKRRDMLREKQREKVVEGIRIGEIAIRQGLNQEMTIKRPGDTCWSSHYSTLINLIYLFSSLIDVLEYIGENGNDDLERGEAIELLDIMSRFEFIFVLFLMRKFLEITHDLSQALQSKDQNIVNAMQLVKVSKYHLQVVRDDGWKSLLLEVVQFCGKHDIVVLEMDDLYTMRGRSRRRTEKMTNLHFYPIRKHIVFPLVYTLIKLSLLLPVAITTVEMTFSAMHIIKDRLRNKMRDDLLNDCLVTYIERDVFVNIDNDDIMNRFQVMKNRRVIL
uniref:DUF4371 domain-containing protein n=1 Tax=Manihot esculenta TaxID=3983 RepID=A0A199UAH7_MANES